MPNRPWTQDEYSAQEHVNLGIQFVSQPVLCDRDVFAIYYFQNDYKPILTKITHSMSNCKYCIILIKSYLQYCSNVLSNKLNEVTKSFYFFLQDYLHSMSSFIDEKLWYIIKYKRCGRDIK